MDQEEIPRAGGQPVVAPEHGDNGRDNLNRGVEPPQIIPNVRLINQRRRPCRLCVQYAREVGLANYAEAICFNCQGPWAPEGLYAVCPRYVIELILRGTIPWAGNNRNNEIEPPAPPPAAGDPDLDQYYVEFSTILFCQLVVLVMMCSWCMFWYYYPAI